MIAWVGFLSSCDLFRETNCDFVKGFCRGCHWLWEEGYESAMGFESCVVSESLGEAVASELELASDRAMGCATPLRVVCVSLTE